MNKRTRKRDIHDPTLVEAVYERIRTMSIEELDAMLTYRKEGVEVTNMNAELAEWYQEQAKKLASAVAACQASLRSCSTLWTIASAIANARSSGVAEHSTSTEYRDWK